MLSEDQVQCFFKQGESKGPKEFEAAIKKLKKKKLDVLAHTANKMTLIHEACMHNCLTAIAPLAKAGINVNAIEASDDETAFFYAASSGNIEAMKILKQCGADINKTNREGLTPLHFAAATNKLKVVSELITMGAKLNEAGPLNMTPICLAAQNGHLEVVQVLLDAGVDIGYLKGGIHKAALIALNHGHQQIFALISSEERSRKRGEKRSETYANHLMKNLNTPFGIWSCDTGKERVTQHRAQEAVLAITEAMNIARTREAEAKKREENAIREREAEQKRREEQVSRERKKEEERAAAKQAQIIEKNKRQTAERSALVLAIEKKQKNEIEKNSLLSTEMVQKIVTDINILIDKLKTKAKTVNECSDLIVKNITENAKHLHSIYEPRSFAHLKKNRDKMDAVSNLQIKSLGKEIEQEIKSYLELCHAIQSDSKKSLSVEASQIFKSNPFMKVMEALKGEMNAENKVILQEAAKEIKEKQSSISKLCEALAQKMKVLNTLSEEVSNLTITVKKCKKSTKAVLKEEDKETFDHLFLEIMRKINAFKNAPDNNESAKINIRCESVSELGESVVLEPLLLPVDLNVPEIENDEPMSETEFNTTTSRSPTLNRKAREQAFIQSKRQEAADAIALRQTKLQQQLVAKTEGQLLNEERRMVPLLFAKNPQGNKPTINTKNLSIEQTFYQEHMSRLRAIIDNAKKVSVKSELQARKYTYALLQSCASTCELVRYGLKDRDIIKIAKYIRNAIYKKHEEIFKHCSFQSLLVMIEKWYQFLEDQNKPQIGVYKDEEAILKTINSKEFLEVYKLGLSLSQNRQNRSLTIEQDLKTIENMKDYWEKRQRNTNTKDNALINKAADDFCWAILGDRFKYFEKAIQNKQFHAVAAFKRVLISFEPYNSEIVERGILARHPMSILRTLEDMEAPQIECFVNLVGSPLCTETKGVMENAMCVNREILPPAASLQNHPVVMFTPPKSSKPWGCAPTPPTPLITLSLAGKLVLGHLITMRGCMVTKNNSSVAFFADLAIQTMSGLSFNAIDAKKIRTGLQSLQEYCEENQLWAELTTVKRCLNTFNGFLGGLLCMPGQNHKTFTINR